VSYLLDASVLISWLKGRTPAVSLLRQLATEGETLVVNTVSVAEVYSGVADKDRTITDELFAAFEYWPIDETTAKLAGTYRYQFDRQGKPLSVTDVLMAAQAIHSDATLVTGNVKDFPMPELKLLRLQHG
jgi:predicted nucleic acid-binding protein